MKNRKRSVYFIILLFITSFLIGVISIPNVNSQVLEGNIDYEFNKNILYDGNNETNINLRHNNLETENYNASYSFENEIGFIGKYISFIDVDDDNITTVLNNIDKHNTIIKYDNDNAWDVAFHNIDNKDYGTIEFWIQLDQNDISTVIRIRDGTSDSGLTIEFRENKELSYYDGSYHVILDVYNYSLWYHFRIDFQCGVGIGYMGLNSQWKLYINNIGYGNYDFWIAGGNPIEMDNFEMIANLNSIMYLDSIGFSWLDNYSIGQNIYPIIDSVDSNILTSDMYQFNFNSDGNPYVFLETPIYGWTYLEYSNHAYLDTPELNNISKKPKNRNGIMIIGHEDGSGIKNESVGLYGNKINITFGIQFKSIDSIIHHSFNITIKSRDNTEIIKLSIIPITTTKVDLYYFGGLYYHHLERFYNISFKDVYNFNLYLENFNVNLRRSKNDIHNNTHSFPFIVNKTGVNAIYFLSYDPISDVHYLFIRLNYVGIYQYNISFTKEFGCFQYGLKDIWDFDSYNLFNLTSYDSIKIIMSSKGYSFNLYILREFNNKPFFCNLYGVNPPYNYSFLYFITDSGINLNILTFTVEGIKVYEYIDNIYNQKYSMYYHFWDINGNYSYFYVDNNNKLNYVFNISQNDVFERLRCWFNIIPHQLSNNKTIFLKGKETTSNIGFPRFRMYYKLAPHFYNMTSWEIHTYYTEISMALRREQTIQTYYFDIPDNNMNNFTNYISKGYIYSLRLAYYPKLYKDPSITILTLSLIAIMIPIIVMFVPTLSVYGVYKKKTAIIPMIFLMSIICFATSLIPFELFFIISISLGCLIFMQYRKGGVD